MPICVHRSIRGKRRILGYFLVFAKIPSNLLSGVPQLIAPVTPSNEIMDKECGPVQRIPV